MHRGLLIIVLLPLDSSHAPLIREFLYGYAADGYRSPLWICAAYDGEPVLVHRQRGTVLYFHQATSEKKIIAIPGIHYFDAHRLDALLLNAPELQLHPRAGNFPEPEGAGDAVDDPSSDEELSTTDGEDTNDDDSVDPKWCPPNPNAQDDPTEEDLIGAAEKLDTMMIARVQPPPKSFSHLRILVRYRLCGSGQTDDLPGPFPREVCQTFPDYCS